MSTSHPIPNHPLFQNLTGKDFNDWHVISYAGKRKTLSYWNCRCKCGVERAIPSGNLTHSKSLSCAECASVRIGKKNRRARHYNMPTYRSWQSMKKRCLNETHVAYPKYGGAGIKVSKRWIESFDSFLVDMGARPSLAHSIDRFPNKNGNYEPGNCRWATKTEQNRNKNNNRIIKNGTQSKCMSEWEEETGISRIALRGRLARGWTPEEALSTKMRVFDSHDKITIDGETRSLVEWATVSGLTYSVLHHRLERGWPLDRLFSPPRRQRTVSNRKK